MRLDDVYLVARALGVAPGKTSLRPAGGRVLFPSAFGVVELTLDETVAEAERIRAEAGFLDAVNEWPSRRTEAA